MRKSTLTIAALGTAAAFVLTACGSDSDSGGSSGTNSSGGGAKSGTVALPAP